MSDAGDLLELLHGAAGRWQSVQTTVRSWRDLEVAEQAHRRWQEEMRQTGRAVSVMYAFAGDGERPRELHPELTLEEAAERAPFAVFAVTELPGGEWRLRIHYNEGFRDRPAEVHLLYHRADGRGSLVLAERAAGTAGRLGHGDRQARFEVERDGTSITFSSETLTEPRLAELAGRLERV